jgi:hypothetical protein
MESRISLSPHPYSTERIEQICAKFIVQLGGGVYLRRSEWLIWFCSPQTGSSLALSISALSAHAVRRCIAESNGRFEVGR